VAMIGMMHFVSACKAAVRLTKLFVIPSA
jgi:hypothetical protein